MEALPREGDPERLEELAIGLEKPTLPTLVSFSRGRAWRQEHAIPTHESHPPVVRREELVSRRDDVDLVPPLEHLLEHPRAVREVRARLEGTLLDVRAVRLRVAAPLVLVDRLDVGRRENDALLRLRLALQTLTLPALDAIAKHIV